LFGGEEGWIITTVRGNTYFPAAFSVRWRENCDFCPAEFACGKVDEYGAGTVKKNVL